ncbi:MAG: hypothetical protein AB9866_28730 [Syntrophobacteraceae bacterium]
MKKRHLFTWTVFIVMLHFLLFFFHSPLVHGAQSARIIPHGNSKILIDGQEFLSEMPLPEGSSLVCRGTCLIQGPDFQLAAHNNAEFSLVQTETGWTLTIKSGRIDFSLQQSANLTIVGPDGTYHAQKVVPASAGGQVKGSITVSGQTTKFAVTEGKLHLAGAAGALLIEPAAGGFGGTAATATAIGLPVAGAGVAAGLGMSGDDKQGKSPN